MIWMLYSASRPLSFWLFPTELTIAKELQYLEGSPFDRNIYIVLMILSIYILIKRKIKWLPILQSNLLFGIWILYCGISIAWSDYQFVAFRRWIKDIGLFLSVLVILTDEEPYEAIKTLMKRFTYVTISYSITSIVFFPDLGIAGDLGLARLNYAGVASNKNGLGRICLISGIFLFGNLISIRNFNRKFIQISRNSMHKISLEESKIYPERTFIQLFLLIIIFYMLGIINSATSLGGLLLGILVYLAMGFPLIKRNIKIVGIITVILIITAIILQITYDYITMFITYLGRDVTLTGRIDIWKDLLAKRTNPWIGVGFGTFWLGERMTSLWDIYYFKLNESHNGYLNVYLELGIIGLAFLFMIILQIYKKIRSDLLMDFDYGRFEMALFIIILLYSITEDTFAKFNVMWFLFILIGISIPEKFSNKQLN